MLSSRSAAYRRARSRSVALAAGVLAALGGAVLTPSMAAAAVSDPFAALRQCESGSNYATNTGNGFYGAYQFDLQTWRGQGLSGLPSAASPATQDAAARALQAQRGWQPWPACSAKLGLTGSAAGPATAAAVPVPAAPLSAAPLPRASRSRNVEAQEARTAPAAPPREILLSVDMVGQVRADVRAWQKAMVERGFALAVDGQYGPASARATHAFEVQHGLHVEAVGVVGPQVRRALASAPAVTG